MRDYPAKFRAGFSLVEVVICIAIVAAVVLPLVALLSQGSSSVTDSEDRFATTRIIQSLESEMHYSPERKAFFIGTETSTTNKTTNDILASPSSGVSVFLGYDRKGKLIREISKGEFSSGISQSNIEILYLVELKISKASGNSSPGVPSLYRFQFSVEQPAFTSERNRTRERLQTLLSGQ